MSMRKVTIEIEYDITPRSPRDLSDKQLLVRAVVEGRVSMMMSELVALTGVETTIDVTFLGEVKPDPFGGAHTGEPWHSTSAPITASTSRPIRGQRADKVIVDDPLLPEVKNGPSTKG